MAYNLKVKSAAAALLGAAILCSLAVMYIGSFDRFFEMTFLSNFIAGITLMFSSIKIAATGRDVPNVVYLDVTVLYAAVVMVCVVFAPGATLGFPAAILHLVMPSAMLLFYMFFCRGDTKPYEVVSALVFPCMYYIFMIVFGKVTGEAVYTYFDTRAMSAGVLIAFAAAACAFMSAIWFLLRYINNIGSGKTKASE